MGARKRPGALQVGPFRFSIEYQDSVIYTPEGPAHGVTRTQSGTITVRTDAHEDFIASTLVHEILHALIACSGAEQLFEGNSEESLVRALEGPLLDLLRDNKDVIRFLQAT